ncbi:hypothetical protein AAG906_029083 [Vitis piasezkii]
MTTLHGSAPSLQRRAEGYISPEDPLIKTPSLHVGASEGLQSLCGYILDSTLPLFSLQLRVHKDRSSLSTVEQSVVVLDALLISVQIIIASMFSPCHVLIPFFMLCRIGSSFTIWIHLFGSE